MILTDTRLAFGGHHADDGEGLVLDVPACAAGRHANNLAHRVVADRKSETTHLVGQFLDCVWDTYPQPRRVATALGA